MVDKPPNKDEHSKLWWLIPIFGLVMMIGWSMAIFELPLASQIAQTGTLWFVASIVVGVLFVAQEKRDEDDKKKK